MGRGDIITFTGDNYHQWADDAKVKLLDKGLIKTCLSANFIPQKKPAESSEAFEERIAPLMEKQDTATFRILESIPFKFRNPKWAEIETTPHSIWNQLKETYGSVSMNTLSACRHELTGIKWTRSSELPAIISRLEKLKYLTEKSQTAPILDAELAIQLLKSYPSDWENFVTQMRHEKDVLETWTIVRDRLLSEYQYRKGNATEQNNITIGHAYQMKHKPKKICTNCKAAGRTRAMKTHKLEDCFFEGGGKAGQFPPHWKRNNFHKKKLGKIGQIGFCDTDEIVIDSGATNHTTNDLNSLYDIEHTSFEAHMPNGTIIEATIKGKLDLILQGDSIGTITDVYYSERFMGTLVSYNQLDNCGCSIYPSPGKLHIKSPQGKVIITAKKGMDYS